MTALMNKENAVLFATPVDPELYPDYYQLIPEPMDFGTILEKVQVCSHTATSLRSLHTTRCGMHVG